MGRPPPTPTDSPSNARVIADLQALSLALRIGGLDGLRSGRVLGPVQARAALTQEGR